MIIDLCPFYSELHLLELRLHQHTFVDRFIIWEFEYDFQDQIKPLHFRNNLECFEQFADRITYYSFGKMQGNTPHEKARHYRDIILPELNSLHDSTVIINTDTDEILRSLAGYNGGIAHPLMDWYVYYMNYFAGNWLNGSVCTMDHLRGKSLYDLRYNHVHDRRKWPSYIMADSGWHFSWTGEHDIIKDKFRNFGNAEGWDKRLLDRQYFESLRERGVKHWNETPLIHRDIDGSFPDYLVKNKHLYKKYLHESQS